VYRALQDLKGWFLNPADARQLWARRNWSPADRAQIAEAIGRGDDEALLDLTKSYVIRRLDQVNGSGASTSRYKFMLGPVATPFWTLAATPVRVTGSAMGSRQRGRLGDVGSTGKNAAMAARSAALFAAQAGTNAAVRAFPAVKGATLLAGGAPILGAFYMARGALDKRNEREESNRANLQSMGSALGRIPGSIADGDVSMLANDLAGLGLTAASESIAGKFIESSTGLGLLRSRLDETVGGAPKAFGSGVTASDVAGMFPSLTALPMMTGDLARQIGTDLYDGTTNTLSYDSKIPIIREFAMGKPSLPIDAEGNANAKISAKVMDAKKGMTADPQSDKIVKKKAKRIGK
jgi:hypothetical protein